jgi:hypothetical protein
MVGTTRPRISLFMQRFHNLGLIETNKDHFLTIKEKNLIDYLVQIALERPRRLAARQAIILSKLFNIRQKLLSSRGTIKVSR